MIDKILDILTFFMLISGFTFWIGIILFAVVYFMTEDHDGK